VAHISHTPEKENPHLTLSSRTTDEIIYCTPRQLPVLLQYVWNAGRVPIIWSAPGMGKSQIIMQVGATLQMPVVSYRLAQRDPTAISGIPFPDMARRVLSWIPDEQWPTLASIIFFDELNRAPILVQNAAFQIMDERRIGASVLPAGCHIVAAVNREQDGGGIIKMPQALANRFVHLHLQSDVDDWCAWALGGQPEPMRLIPKAPRPPGIHPAVIGFIRFRREALHEYSAKAPAWPSARAWEFVSDVLWQNPPDDLLLQLAAGTVGHARAIEFGGFLPVFRRMQTFSVDAILMTPMTAPVPKADEGASLYAISVALGQLANEQNFGAVAAYVDRLPSEEYGAFTVHAAPSAHHRPCCTRCPHHRAGPGDRQPV